MNPGPTRTGLKPLASPERRRMVAAGTIVLAVYAIAVCCASWALRAQWRHQVLEREGEVLSAVAALQATLLREEAGAVPDLGDDALEVALNTSRLRGVVAVRIFDRDGHFLDAVPAQVDEVNLDQPDLVVLDRDRQVVRLHECYPLGELVLDAAAGARVTLLEVTTSLPPGPGATADTRRLQYWIDGEPVAAELLEGNRHISAQAALAFATGSVLIVGTLAWAFRRLDRANRLLRERASDLDRANRELAQTARTAALGAVTAHLVHGVRSPFAGLENMVAAGAQGASAPGGEEWQAARDSARRIRALLDEVQGVLGDLADDADYEVTAAELCAGLRERLGSEADRRRVVLEVRVPAEGLAMHPRVAGLAGLVLANLLQNAIEASREGGRVEIACGPATEGWIEFRVRDEAGGLPPDVAADPFRVRRSSKPSGAGIGLAISQELARHAGGAIELVDTRAAGTQFRLRIPAPIRGKPSSLKS